MKRAQHLTDFFAISLQRILLLAVTIIVTLVMIVFGFYLINAHRERVTNDLEARATRTANLLAQTIALPLWDIDAENIRSQIDIIMTDPEVNEVRVFEAGSAEPIVKISRDTPAISPITHKAIIALSRSAEKIPLGTVEIVYSNEMINSSLTNITITIIVVTISLLGSLYFTILWLVGHRMTSSSPTMDSVRS